MGIRVGIDAGSTSTKLAAINGKEIIDLRKVKSVPTDCDIYEVFDTFLSDNQIGLSEVEAVSLTGVGASGFSEKLEGKDTKYVHEFDANVAGASFLSGIEDDFLLISMGTGTTYIRVKDGKSSHLGGLGLGGGSLIGLAESILGTDQYIDVENLAGEGHCEGVNLMMSDVTTTQIEGLAMDITVSNFGKLSENPSRADLAAGIMSLVFENVIQGACLLATHLGINKIVLIGGLSESAELGRTMAKFEKMYTNIKFVLTDKGQYVTAIGTAIS